MIRKLLAWGLLAAATPADAAWHVASSDHFIVYTQGNDAGARDAAARLEKFQFVLRFLTGAKQPSSPVKVSVFMLPSEGAVQATMPFGGSDSIAGYYDTAMRGPYAIMSRAMTGGMSDPRDHAGDTALKGQQILFHELTHHFTRQYFPAAYPTWYSEGFADYVGSMQIAANDVVTIGEPVNNRYLSFEMNDWLPVPKMLKARNYADVGGNVFLLYSEGWLLVHYLSNTKARPGQLRAYLTALNAGKPFDEAAAAFGDLGKLDGELRGYAARGSLSAIVLPFKAINTGPIEARALTPPEEAMLPFDMRLYAGVPQAEAGAFADRVAAAAARFPDDPHALSVLVDAQRLAGRSADAAKAANHWAAVAPGDGLAIAAKAAAQADQLAAARVRDVAAWQEVRRLYADAAKKAPNQPRILRGFYETYRSQGVMPPESAQNALFTAFELLPQQDELRHEVAADFEQRGMIDEAIAVIRPLAFESTNPDELSPGERAKRDRERSTHRLAGDDDAETPRQMLKRLEGKRGTAQHPAQKPAA